MQSFTSLQLFGQEFSVEEFDDALAVFGGRERRFRENDGTNSTR